MVLKKKNLIKQVKNFTLNFGPQHPAAHVRRYIQINRYDYLILLFFVKFLRIKSNKVNYNLDGIQTNHFVYLGSNKKQFWYSVLFIEVLWVWLMKMNSCFKNAVSRNIMESFLIYVKKLCMSIIFFIKKNNVLQRRPTIIKVMFFYNITFFYLIKSGNWKNYRKFYIYFLIYFQGKMFEKANVLSNVRNIIVCIRKFIAVIFKHFFVFNCWNLWINLLNSILPFKFLKTFFF